MPLPEATERKAQPAPPSSPSSTSSTRQCFTRGCFCTSSPADRRPQSSPPSASVVSRWKNSRHKELSAYPLCRLLSAVSITVAHIHICTVIIIFIIYQVYINYLCSAYTINSQNNGSGAMDYFKQWIITTNFKKCMHNEPLHTWWI